MIAVKKHPRFNVSRADRKSIVILTTINALNGEFLKDQFIADKIDEGAALYDVIWHKQDMRHVVDTLLPLFLEVETDPLFVYAYVDTWAQVMLESLQKKKKIEYWQSLLQYTTAILNSADFDEEMYQCADDFFIAVKNVIRQLR